MSKRILMAAAVALALGACATDNSSKQQSGSSETAGQYVDDATVTAKVKTEIASDVGVKAASNVNVETYRGVVELSGFVDSQEMASRALAAAKKVSGIKTLKNDLRVKAS